MELLRTNGRFFVLLTLISLLPIPLCIVAFNWAGEDCFISYRYAENFAEGHGLVFNTTSHDRESRVEGYSNLLMILILAACHKLGLSVIYASRWLCALSVCASAWMLGLTMRTAAPSDRPRLLHLLPSLLLAMQPLAILHANRALETTFHMALITAAVMMWVKRRPISTFILLSLVVLSRPEGIMWLFPFFCAWVFERISPHERATQPPLSPTRLAVGLAIWLVTSASLFIWQYLYYGQWMANSVHSKVIDAHTGLYFASTFLFLRCTNFLPLLAPMSFIGFGDASPERRRTVVIAMLVILQQIAFIICVGNVLTIANRFFVPSIPMICLLMGLAVIAMPNRRLRVMTAIAIICLNLYTLDTSDGMRGRLHVRLIELVRMEGEWVNPLDRLRFQWNWYHSEPIRFDRRSAEWMNETLPEDAVVAADQMGQFGYYGERPLIDIFGLLDEQFAREPVTARNLIARNPTHVFFIQWVEMGTYLSHQQRVYEDPLFEEHYRLRWIVRSRVGFLELGLFHVFVRSDLDDGLPVETVYVPGSLDECRHYWRM